MSALRAQQDLAVPEADHRALAKVLVPALRNSGTVFYSLSARFLFLFFSFLKCISGAHARRVLEYPDPQREVVLKNYMPWHEMPVLAACAVLPRPPESVSGEAG